MAVLRVLLCAFATLSSVSCTGDQTDKGWELRVTSSEGPTSRTCFDTKVSVKGTYFLGGPAKFESLPEGNWKFQAIFDGLGMINKFELRPKDQSTKICYSSAWMNTGMYEEFRKDPKSPPRGVLFEDTVPARSKCFMSMCDFKAPNDNNWVNMLPVGDKAVMVTDTPTMVVIDPETLNCSGLHKWADDVKDFTGMVKPKWVPTRWLVMGGSAHPLLRPGTQTVVEILGVSSMMGGKHNIDVYTFDPSKKGLLSRTFVASVPSDAAQYIHSFGVTPNYVVLPFNLQMSGIGPGHKPIMMGDFTAHWKGIQVVDFNKKLQVFDDMAPFYHVHIANTFENASGITMDLGAYDEIPFERMAVMDIAANLNKTGRDTSFPRGQLRRYHMNLETKKTTMEKLTDNNKDYDFIKINPSKNGLPYCVYYAVEWYHDDHAYASMAMMKHDICQGKKSYWSQVDTYLNEPFFIPNSENGAEDDGTLIFTANDGQKGKAIFVSLDAHTFTEIERIELPNHLPFTAHGQFIPAPSEALVV